MSFYGNLKEIYRDTTEMIQGRNSAGKIVYFLKSLSFVAVCSLYLMEKCGLKSIISCNTDFEIGVPPEISDFLSMHNIYIIIVAYFIYFLVCKAVIRIIAVEMKFRWDKDICAVWFTVEDVFEIFFHGTILLKTIQDILQSIKGDNVMHGANLWVYAFITIGALFRFISKLYRQNSDRRCDICRTYTDFFDSDGKRIAENDEVVYRNRLYNLYKVKGTCYLSDYSIGSDIKLEDAVMDKEGKIKVYFFNMERRQEGDKV